MWFFLFFFRIHNALKGIPDDRDGLFDTIQRSKNHYQKRAYQCIKCMVALFSNCPVAYQILQVISFIPFLAAFFQFCVQKNPITRTTTKTNPPPTTVIQFHHSNEITTSKYNSFEPSCIRRSLYGIEKNLVKLALMIL